MTTPRQCPKCKRFTKRRIGKCDRCREKWWDELERKNAEHRERKKYENQTGNAMLFYLGIFFGPWVAFLLVIFLIALSLPFQ